MSGYELVAHIGAGGFADVFRARGPAGDVAVKRMRAGRDAADTALLMREALIGAKLAHPGIAAVRDWYWDDRGRLCLVTELVEGRDLAAVLAWRGALPVAVALHVARQLLEALRYAHETADVIHRDISPHNVLVGWDGAVRLSDFGIAKPAPCHATTGVIRGKPSYLAPEQLARRPLDGRADLFAVGVVLYQMLTGRHPFPGMAAPDAVVPPPSTVRAEPPDDAPDVLDALDAFVLRLLAYDRDARFPSAEAALDALPEFATQGAEQLAAVMAAFRETLRAERRPRPELPAAAKLRGELPTDHPPTRAPRPPNRQKRFHRPVLILAAGLAFGAAGVTCLHDGTAPRSPTTASQPPAPEAAVERQPEPEPDASDKPDPSRPGLARRAGSAPGNGALAPRTDAPVPADPSSATHRPVAEPTHHELSLLE